MGDLLYSLCFVREYLEALGATEAHFHLQTNVPDLFATHGRVFMTRADADFLLPLVERSRLFSKITRGDASPEWDDLKIELGMFRYMKINVNAGDIRAWYYNFTTLLLPMELSRPVFPEGEIEPNFELAGRLVFVASPRYRNVFVDYKALAPFADRMVFMGLEEEHRAFCREFFPLPFRRVGSALEAAQLMRGAAGVVSNLNGLYAIAECLKVPRVLITPEMMPGRGGRGLGPVNVIPQGGVCCMAQIQEKLLAAIPALLSAARGN